MFDGEEKADFIIELKKQGKEHHIVVLIFKKQPVMGAVIPSANHRL